MSSALLRSLSVALGGALGALGRYWVSGWVGRISSRPIFPWGTFAVNISGAFLLGAFLGYSLSGRHLVSPALRSFVAIGVLGAFTTFSTFSYESMEALRAGDYRIAFGNIFISLFLGLVAVWLGLLLGRNL